MSDDYMVRYNGRLMGSIERAVDRAFDNARDLSWPCESKDCDHCEMDRCGCECHLVKCGRCWLMVRKLVEGVCEDCHAECPPSKIGLQPGTRDWERAHETHLYGDLRGERE